LAEVTVVADAGMVSEANQKDIEAAGLSFILGMKIPAIPYVVKTWRAEHPGEPIPDGHVFTQPWPAGPHGGRRDQVIYYQYRHDRARRTLRGIDEQVAKARNAIAGRAPIKRNRFIQLSEGTHTLNRDLEARARALAGIKGYITNLQACPDGTPITADFVVGAYHRLFEIETSKPQCCHSCGLSALSWAPSSAVLGLAAWLFVQGFRLWCPRGSWCSARRRSTSAGSARTTVSLVAGCRYPVAQPRRIQESRVIVDMARCSARSRSHHSCGARAGRLPRAGMWERWMPTARSKSVTALGVKAGMRLGGRKPSALRRAAICAVVYPLSASSRARAASWG
jgi:hypothetical protein